MNTRKLILWILIVLVVISGYLLWRRHNSAGADVVNKPTSYIPTTVAFFGRVSVENNTIPLNKIRVFAGSAGGSVQGNGEFTLFLTKSAWNVGTDQSETNIPVRFINGDSGKVLAIKGFAEPYTLQLPAEWSGSANVVRTTDANSYVPSSAFSVKQDFVLSNSN